MAILFHARSKPAMTKNNNRPPKITLRMHEKVKVWQGEVLLGTLWLAKVLCKPQVFRKKYWAVLIHLVRKTDLFDRTFYLEANPDVAEENMFPLRHYISYGDREGRLPLPVFDPHYYRSRIQGRTKHVNALLHYAYIGRYRRISPSPWFDVNYYLAQNKDVARSGYEPILHYLKFGGLEGRSPNPQFDGAYYLRNNPDVIESYQNPLLHYLQSGRMLERPNREAAEHGMINAGRERVAPEMWASLSPRNSHPKPLVDVIVPVYKDRELTLRCLYKVLAEPNDTPFELIVINDCSPDQELVAELDELANQNLFTLLHNENNCGFVFTINRGLGLHPERDVVMLNSDTEVYANWLDRLRTAANRHPRTATVTPLSNNATICSYPRFLHDNPYPLELSYAELDALTAKVNSEFEVEAPSGVGFCMYLRRDALNDVGQFDEDLFGRGYGEENDYCQRAIQKGWRNIIAADIFVRHLGGASFQGEKAKRVAAAMTVMRKRHPGYPKSVEAFIRENVLYEARHRLDWGRLKAHVKAQNTLFVCHNRGGGSERHLQEDTKILQQQGIGVFYLRPERGRPTHARLGNPFCRQLLNLPLFELTDIHTLATALKDLNITSIHSHGLVDFIPDAPEHIMSLAQTMGVPLQVDIHDYKVICPRINLADSDGRYCGEPEERECDKCLVSQGNDFGARSIKQWREMHRRVLSACEKIWVPDPDVATRLTRYYPEVVFTVEPHESMEFSIKKVRKPQMQASERLRIVVIGAIGKIKGFDILLACAKDAKMRQLPLDFIVMGYSMNDRLLEQTDVYITGRYLDQDAETTLDALAPHAVWLPSIWPETYSYTLSLALKGSYPVFAFNIGAIGRRLAEVGQAGNLWPLQNMDSPSWINARFSNYRALHLLCTGDSNESRVVLESD
jgi:GT2 family glycosyltransferase/glycosyltransferase involved in cell wall biosynthesis